MIIDVVTGDDGLLCYFSEAIQFFRTSTGAYGNQAFGSGIEYEQIIAFSASLPHPLPSAPDMMLAVMPTHRRQKRDDQLKILLATLQEDIARMVDRTSTASDGRTGNGYRWESPSLSDGNSGCDCCHGCRHNLSWANVVPIKQAGYILRKCTPFSWPLQRQSSGSLHSS